MSPAANVPRVTAVRPAWAIEGGRVDLVGSGFPIDRPAELAVRIGGQPARVVFASPSRLGVLLPAGIEPGHRPIEVAGAEAPRIFLDVGGSIATGLHQVDDPAFDLDRNLYVTYSGSRGQQVPVSIFRVSPSGAREPFVTGIVNATSIVRGPDDRLYVSSRFEGAVYRVAPDGRVEPFATDLGVACGLAFGPDGELYVGDRSGTVFRLRDGGRAEPFATLPASVAAFHLAMGPDDCLYVTGPTLAPRDVVYRIDPAGRIETMSTAFGRPQGLGFDAEGRLYVVEALAGSSGVYRFTGHEPEQVMAGPGLVGLAFDPAGGFVVTSNETAWRLDVDVRG